MVTGDNASGIESRERDAYNRYSPSITIYLQENLPGDSPEENPADVELTLWTGGEQSVITKAVSKNGKLLSSENPDNLSQEVRQAKEVFDAHRRIGNTEYSWPGFYRQLKRGEPITDSWHITDTPQFNKLVKDMGAFLEQSERAHQMEQISSGRSIYIGKIAKQSLSNLTRTI